MKFEWDPQKEQLNVRKHRVSFEEACYVFVDKNALSLFDGKHSKNEDRWVTMGRDPAGRLLVLVHTYRTAGKEEIVRIISARRATMRERKQYRERIR